MLEFSDTLIKFKQRLPLKRASPKKQMAQAVREKMGKVVVNEEFCKGCALCVNVCPQHLLRTAKHVSKTSYRPAELADPESKCTGCGLCALVCPDAAIRVYRDKKVGAKKND